MRFYDKIKVPPPTFCPECRLQRRLAFRNEKQLYRRKCDLTGKEIISVHVASAPFKVYEAKEWFSDRWDPMAYGFEYDFSKLFFEQFYKLMLVVPRISLMIDYPTLVNSDYTNLVGHLKNCYLISEADFDENCAYASSIKYSKDSFDILMGQNLELCYECVNCRKCHTTYFSEDCEDCIEVAFSKNLIGCSNCVGCTNLRKKQYHIFNQPYTKDEYLKRIQELELDSYRGVIKLREETPYLRLKFPQKYMHERHNTKVVGDYIYYSKNSFGCNEVVGVEDSKYCQIISVKPTRDCFDYTEWGNNAALLYECLTVGEGANNVKFSNLCWPNVRDIEYSILCRNSSNLFGCIGVRSKQFCIFNKQYSEKDYHALREKIINHMNETPYKDKAGRIYRYGEFFPIELSPFMYNETNAQDFFPLTRDKALEQGFSWKDPEQRNYEVTLYAKDLPDHIKDVNDTVLSEIIGCLHNQTCNEQCTQAFRIIPQELDFLRKMNLSLPRLCPNCRHYQRIKRRNPLKLWHRKCQCAGKGSSNGVYTNTAEHLHHSENEHCPNEFETTYAPERPEIVYCEECYLREVV